MVCLALVGVGDAAGSSTISSLCEKCNTNKYNVDLQCTTMCPTRINIMWTYNVQPCASDTHGKFCNFAEPKPRETHFTACLKTRSRSVKSSQHTSHVCSVLAMLVHLLCVRRERCRSTDTKWTGYHSIDVRNALCRSTAVPEAQTRVPVLQKRVDEVHCHGENLGTHPVGFVLRWLGVRRVITTHLG